MSNPVPEEGGQTLRKRRRHSEHGFSKFLPFLNANLGDDFATVMEECLGIGDDTPGRQELLKFKLKEYQSLSEHPEEVTLEGAKKLQTEVKDIILMLLTEDKKTAVYRAVTRYMEKLRPALGAHWFIEDHPPTSGRTLALKPEFTGFDTLLWNELDLLLSDPRWPDKIGRCPECGKIFTKIRSDQKWCSKNCKDRVANRASRQPRAILSS